MTFIAQRDFLIEVQKGNVPKHSLVHKFGRNDAIPNGSWAFVNLLGFTSWPLSTPKRVRIKAGNVNDIAGGTGALGITVQGIDDSLDEASEVFVTTGGSASATSSTYFWRVHRAWVSGAGVYGGGNTGDVVVETAAGLADLIKIAASEGQSQFAGFSIPDGKTGYVLSVDLTVDAGKAADVKLLTRKDLNNTTAPMESVRLKKYWDGVIGHLSYHPRSPDVTLPALTDVWIEARGSAISQVSADIEILLVDD